MKKACACGFGEIVKPSRFWFRILWFGTGDLDSLRNEGIMVVFVVVLDEVEGGHKIVPLLFIFSMSQSCIDLL